MVPRRFRRSLSGSPQIVEVDPHRILHMPEAITAEMLAAEPPGHHDDVVAQPFALQDPQDHDARACLALIVLEWRQTESR